MNSVITTCIPTFIINLKRREDRKAHIIKEFEGRDEFRLQIIEALECSNGALGLWSTIRHILLDMMNGKEEYVLIGEDDIEFTEQYSKEYLLNNIAEAQAKDADVLLGGISWYSEAVQIADNLFWADSFTGTHFTIIFKKFFQKLINTHFRYTSADFKMVSLSRDIMFMHPFAAIQKDFGYSDATQKNNVEGRVASLFRHTKNRLQMINAIQAGYSAVLSEQDPLVVEQNVSHPNIQIPTYVILDDGQTKCDQEFLAQFDGRPEFNLHQILRPMHESDKMSFWLAVREAINSSIANEDDMMIICTGQHRFTADYDRDVFIRNIINAHEDSADVLFGGADDISGVIPFKPDRFWIGSSPSLNFAVFYRKFYDHVLNRNNDENIERHSASPYQSKIVSKLLTIPVIATATPPLADTETKEEVQKKLIERARSTKLLNDIQEVILKYDLFNRSLNKVS